MKYLLIALVCLTGLIFAQETQEAAVPMAELTGFAILPADTFADGPASGQFQGDGSKLPAPRFPAQPVQGFSGVQFAPECGEYLVLSDNGFGSKYNSIDYLLRLYTIKADPITAEGGTGAIQVTGMVELRDPAQLVPFFIAREFTTDRYLTGFDFDIESVVFDNNGSMWIGDEFGPYLLHFDRDGRLLEAPIPTPLDPSDNSDDAEFVRAPHNPALLARAPQPASESMATIRTSRGFEGMATSPDRSILYPMLEGTVVGDPAGSLRIYRFDPMTSSYHADFMLYQLEDAKHAIGDFTVINDEEFLVIERDNKGGDAAQFKKIYLINLSETDDDGFVSKTEVADLLNIANPEKLAGFDEIFRFPFFTIEDVLVLDSNTIIVLNDNNYPSGDERVVGAKNPNEMITLKLSTELQLAEGVGTPAHCHE